MGEVQKNSFTQDFRVELKLALDAGCSTRNLYLEHVCSFKNQ
jgi:hypothetical protein